MNELDTEYSNIVTPPDFVDEKKHTVLMIDIDAAHIQSLGAYLKNCDNYFNIYLYHSQMGNTDWFTEARNRADSIVVNTESNSFSTIKDLLAELPHSWYYGPKTFVKNSKRLQSPIDYFTNYTKDT